MSIGDDLDLEPVTPGPAAPGWRPGGRLVRGAISVWLVFHLAAIIVSPAAVAPSSGLVREVRDWFGPYLEFLYLDHGYHFFAPEPTESTLLVSVAERADGTAVRGQAPDRATWPRLLYHRYFMLTEHMKDAPEELRDLWYQSYARQIGRETGASQVTLIQQTHNLPTMERTRDGGRLNDPESYEERSLGTFPCDGY